MKIFFNIILCYPFLCAVAQQEPDKIFWKENELTWEDFIGQPDPSSTYQANTSAGLSYSWGLRSENGITELKYEVLSYFNPDGSWVNPESSTNEFLLAHEQLHFDIAELHARKLRKKLAEIKIEQLGKDPRAILNKLYENINKENAAMQIKYDKESNHSINKEGEYRWRDFIKAEIRKYEDFDIKKKELQP